MKQSDLKRFIQGQITDEIRLMKFIKECIQVIFKEDSDLAMEQFDLLMDHFNTVPSLMVISHNVENRKEFLDEEEEEDA